MLLSTYTYQNHFDTKMVNNVLSCYVYVYSIQIQWVINRDEMIIYVTKFTKRDLIRAIINM